MNWYVTSLLLHRDKADLRDRRCNYLLAALDHESAYRKARETGRGLEVGGFGFAGIVDLLQVYDPPQNGSELLWSELELKPSELLNQIKPKQKMRAFLTDGARRSGWYVGEIVLSEIHDQGSHGECTLAWINSHLIQAADPEAAYIQLMRIGKGQQGAPGSHRCDGDAAHWEFKGIRDLITVSDAPRDGALLWCDELRRSGGAPGNLIREKRNLSVFKWEAEQRKSGN